MATRFTTPPTLDRLITLTVQKTVATPGQTFRYATRETFLPGTGEWNYVGNLTLDIGRTDSDGAMLPANIPDGTAITVAWGGYSLATTADGFSGSNPNRKRLTLADIFDTSQATGELMLTIGGGSETTAVETPVWAARRDFTGRDTLEPGGLLAITRSRFIVRAGVSLVIGDIFTDDDGNRRTIQGIAEIGRGRYLEILGQTFSTKPGG